ncbi:uncharacterized protein LOC121503418 [Cheilinus undulatus]|uniref:uncharacterized protein LOC121503418 n=1 Tax=Cheilinus undulatus TaxID=241271 RepID=UPI001BD38204|nr:uncharacterized protein LOC121503418 [Cheilinus undulatus]
MALGLLLLLSCNCFILFDGGAALPAVKGYGYPYMPDAHNIGDDADDQVLFSTTSDQSELQASNNELSSPVHTSYNNPPAEQQPDSAPSHSYIQSPTFSYQPGDAVEPQPDPVQPQAPAYQEPAADYPSFYAGQPEPVSSAYEDNSVYSQAVGHSKETPHLVYEHVEPPMYEDQSSNTPHLVYEEVFQYSSEQAEPPLYEHHSSNNPYLVYEEVFQYPSEHAQSPLYEDYSGNTPHLVYEDVFEYPSERAESSGYENIHSQANYNSPSHEQALPINSLGPRSFFGGLNLNFGQTDKPKHNKITWRPPKPAFSTKKVSHKAHKPLAPLLLPSHTSAIIQSRKTHKQPRYFLSHLKHKPEFSALKALKLEIKRPALIKKAAHKVLRPQSTRL